MKRLHKFLLIFWGAIVLGIGALVLLFHLIANGNLGFMPSLEELANPHNRFASEIYFEDGPMMGQYFKEENRRFVEYNDIPKCVIDALIATEDVRFYEHSGIDMRGLVRVFKGLITGNTSSAGGGSTISQQLAKMLFPREKNMSKMELVFRKLREWVIAVKLEKNYTKEEIIAMYLNKYDFVNLAVGISSASEIYFGIPVDSLKIEQAAMLVGMAKNSSLYNPVVRPEKTLGRRNVVLSQMHKYGMIDKVAEDSLSALPLGLNFSRVSHKEGLATYFREYLRLYLTANKPDKSKYRWNKDQYPIDSLAWENDPLYGWVNKNSKPDGTKYNLYSDGLKIHTSLDSRMQRYAEEAVREHLGKTLQPTFDRERRNKKNPPFSNDLTKEEIDKIMNTSIKRSERYTGMKSAGVSEKEIMASFKERRKMKIFTWNGVRDTLMSPEDSLKHYKSFFRAGVMVMEPSSGEVKAYVGGPDYRYFMYDMVSVGKRQVGSTIKPILYTLAMQEGLSPCEQVPNIPQTFILPDGTSWTARGGTKRVGEMVTLKWGLANSENNISGWVLKQFTPQAVVDMARKMGISAFIDPVPSIFLGTSEISVKEMTAAYSIFANKGVYNTPLVVTRIEDKLGNVLEEFVPESRDVITEQTAYLMCNLLQGVVDEGTGVRLRYRYQFKNAMGGKTGTTQSHSDGWFMAVTPELVGGVWVGAEDRSVRFQNLANGQGANMSLPIWALFLQKVQADESLGYAGLDFIKPTGMNIQLDCNEVSYEEEEEFY